jgi:hypothetical protein
MDIKNSVVCNHFVGNPPVPYKLESCPRCNGTGVYGGPDFSLGGQISTVRGSSQLEQQIKKILTERIRETGYGFDFSVLKGIISQGTLLVVKQEIFRCLDYLYGIQQSEKANGFYYNSNEEIAAGRFVVNVYQLPDEPRELVAEVSVRTVSGAQTSVTVSLRR